MTFRHTGRRTRNFDRGALVLEYVVSARQRVSLCISDEAIEDHGEAAAIEVGERKLARALAQGQVPAEILITTNDFR